MVNVVCVKWGDKYSSLYVNRLFNMLKRHMPVPFRFHCYTEDPKGINKNVNIIPINSDLEGWWCKLDLLDIFDYGETILFDLDVVILNDLERLCSVRTRTLSVLYSQWKEGFLQPEKKERYDTLYNSSVMKWEGDQGKKIYEYFSCHKQLFLLKYKGIDRLFFNENVDVDLLPTGIAYSYWKGAKYLKDSTPEKLRDDYEVCILNHGLKNEEVDSWIKKYWR
jgi:hypothetical protein